MRWLRQTLTGLLLFAAAFSATPAELPELLKPVSPAIEAKLMARTNFDFRWQRYSAKRWRVVDINFPLLEQEGAQFTITAFPDLRIAVKARTTSRQPKQEGMREWVGDIDSSENVSLGARGEPVDVPDQSVSIWLSEGPRTVSLKVARRIAAEEGDVERLRFLPEPSAARVTTKLDVITASGQWIARPGVQVVLQPIDDDPRFHFVYEVDWDKLPTSNHGGPDNERKLRAQRSFFLQLEKERAAEAAVE
jgi:hypothetical protein